MKYQIVRRLGATVAKADRLAGKHLRARANERNGTTAHGRKSVRAHARSCSA